MPVSRHSFRRVIGDMVHRYNARADSANEHQWNTGRLLKKADRNSLISNESLSVRVRMPMNDRLLIVRVVRADLLRTIASMREGSVQIAQLPRSSAHT